MNFGDTTIDEFLDSLASKEPTPGGGVLSGIVTALSTSLGSMVLAYTKGKKKYSKHESFLHDCGNFLVSSRAEAMKLASADAAAYATLNSLWKLDYDDPKKLSFWNDAVEQAIDVPIQTMELCNKLLATMNTMIGKTNRMLVSDLATASILANTSTEIAALTARINLPLVKDETRKIELTEKISSLLASCNSLAHKIDSACRSV
jgi:formiminotetrahydrofolate cyclodeaminase